MVPELNLDDTPPTWVEIDDTGPIEIFEFVPNDDPATEAFAEEFLPDSARNKAPSAREQNFPDLFDAISAFRTQEDARRLWSRIAARVGPDRVRMGPFIARVRLEPGHGFRYDDTPDSTGHIYVEGETSKLVDAVVDVVHVGS
jgi:hypothetical protein